MTAREDYWLSAGSLALTIKWTFEKKWYKDDPKERKEGGDMNFCQNTILYNKTYFKSCAKREGEFREVSVLITDCLHDLDTLT